MSDEKEVLELRSQIEKDTKEWCNWMLESDEDFDAFSHEMGRESQDPIAWNRCLETVIRHAQDSAGKFVTDGAQQKFIAELEKIRR